jgi:type IV pilus assembly protein PilC
LKIEKFVSFCMTFSLRRSISHKELALSTRHLALMVKSGVQLTRSLEILAAQASPRLKGIFLDVADHIRNGETFADSLGRRDQFPRLYVALVRSAEVAGNLEEVLYLLSAQLEREVELRSRVRNALMYPAVIISAMTGVGILMMILVVPKLAETFKDLNVPLPISTQIIVGIAALLRDWWFLLPLAGGALILGMRALFKREKARFWLSWSALHAPLLKTLVARLQIAIFARTLASLLQGGVAVLDALSIVRGTTQNALYKNSLVIIASRVERGEALSKAMRDFEALYPPLVQQMVTVGEESGSLIDVLKHVADFFEAEVADLTKGLATLIEPVLMIVVGTAVGFFAVSMLQPMYSLLNAV